MTCAPLISGHLAASGGLTVDELTRLLVASHIADYLTKLSSYTRRAYPTASLHPRCRIGLRGQTHSPSTPTPNAIIFLGWI